MIEGNLARDGFCMLRDAVDHSALTRLLHVCEATFIDHTQLVRARSSRGHVYAARNLIESIPEVTLVWQDNALLEFLHAELGEDFGLVRALFFDKPPDRTWALPWHKDTAIAVEDNSSKSCSFSRPTTKAGVPHFVACDDVLRRMLTLRVHLDDVTDENGPLKVIPGSHISSESDSKGANFAVTIHAAAGDVLAMRPLISHASGASQAGTSRHRRILHLEFSADRTLPDGIQWHDFLPAGTHPPLLKVEDVRG